MKVTHKFLSVLGILTGLAGLLFLQQNCSGFEPSSSSRNGPSTIPYNVLTDFRVLAPNGSDPMVGAVVALSRSEFGNPASLNCTSNDTNSLLQTCTDAQGTFNLDFTGLEIGDYFLTINKGYFGRTYNAKFENGELVVQTAGSLKLPANALEGNIPRIAVVTGVYDRMEYVLGKLGLARMDELYMLVPDTAAFKIYQGIPRIDIGIPDIDDALTDVFVEELLTSLTEMQKFDIIILNCGVDETDALFTPAVLTNIQQFVSAGGRLYVTDQPYDFLEQAFPQYLDFYGDGAGNPLSPEPMNAAEVGLGDPLNMTIQDPALITWLKMVKCGENLNENCLNVDDTAPITDLLGGWAMVEGIHTQNVASVKNWGTANVVDLDGVSAVRPLTLTIEHGSGRILYSSYHTASMPHAGLHVEERILQYLLFELAD